MQLILSSYSGGILPNFYLAPFRNVLIAFTPQGRTTLLPTLQVTQNLSGYLQEETAIEVVHTLNMLLG